jgi:hypothetical protein
VARSDVTGPLVSKAVWTERDFDQMGWHNNAMHAWAFEPADDYPGRLLIDLDYIVKVEKPAAPGGFFDYWVSPATLVFDRASDLVADVNAVHWGFALTIDEIERSAPDKHGMHLWTLTGDLFTLTIRSDGYTQYLRAAPRFCRGRHRLPLSERGGIAFDERGYES